MLGYEGQTSNHLFAKSRNSLIPNMEFIYNRNISKIGKKNK